MELTSKQRLFVHAYLNESRGNATDAARRAGYRHPNMAGPRLMVSASIRAAVESQLVAAAMPANEVLARLSEHATADIGDFIKIADDGTCQINLSKARKAKRTKLIKKIKTKTKTTTSDRGVEVEVQTEIELHNPQFALDKLARYHGIYRELKANDDDIEDRLRDAEREAGEAPGPVPERPDPLQ